MSRPSSFSASSSRSLTLTEELEKIEQSITLTLQEIDHHFSLTHRILTTSILPLVSQYADHSHSVWEASKFWKQFFEASANVSLSGYEERPPGADDEVTVTETDTTGYDDTMATTADETGEDDSNAPATPSQLGGSPSLTTSTPRAAATGRRQKGGEKTPKFASYPSPYETLKAELSPNPDDSSSQDPPAPRTPLARLPKMDMRTPTDRPLHDDDGDEDASHDASSSPFSPSGAPTMTLGNASRPAAPAGTDRLMHRVLDRNYRLLATPHSTQRAPPSTARRTAPRQGDDSDDDLSSPELPPPRLRLRSEIFSSPAVPAARTPGVSVLDGRGKNATPRRGEDKRRSSRPRRGEWSSSDSDGEEGYKGGMEPPTRTRMVFEVPESRVLKTPAREASRRIVDDLLLTAGGDPNPHTKHHPVGAAAGGADAEDEFDDFEIDVNAGEDFTSPAIVRGGGSKGRARGGEDTF